MHWYLGSIIALVMTFLTGCSRAPDDEYLRDLFQEHRAEFVELRDMILAEPNLLSIGDDNVGDFWLFHGKWTTHKPPYTMYTENEMLELVGLSPKRYRTYLDLLRSIGGYRVTKQLGQHSKGQVTIHIFRTGITSSGQTVNIMFSTDAPMPIVDDSETMKSSGICYSIIEDGWYIEREWN